jgi:hypothetical protein
MDHMVNKGARSVLKEPSNDGEVCVLTNVQLERNPLILGFEVTVVRDAIAAPKIPEGDGGDK